jgi:tRNA pseudouridine13 synthase
MRAALADFLLHLPLLLMQAALGVVARMLHCQSRSFGFAGTKDKRGVTTQWVTAFKVAPAKLAALNPRCEAAAAAADAVDMHMHYWNWRQNKALAKQGLV